MSSTPDHANFYTDASNFEKAEFREWFHVLLQEREVKVEFVKSNGNTREMKCTLNENLGAKYSNKNATENTRKPNPDICVVWDLDQSAWRSFRWDRLKKVQFEIG